MRDAREINKIADVRSFDMISLFPDSPDDVSLISRHIAPPLSLSLSLSLSVFLFLRFSAEPGIHSLRKMGAHPCSIRRFYPENTRWSMASRYRQSDTGTKIIWSAELSWPA